MECGRLFKGKIMSKEDTTVYKQCVISYESCSYVAWIPTHLAKVGKVVKPKGKNLAIVKEVYDQFVITHEEVVAIGDYWKHQREASDI